MYSRPSGGETAPGKHEKREWFLDAQSPMAIISRRKHIFSEHNILCDSERPVTLAVSRKLQKWDLLSFVNASELYTFLSFGNLGQSSKSHRCRKDQIENSVFFASPVQANSVCVCVWRARRFKEEGEERERLYLTLDTVTSPPE